MFFVLPDRPTPPQGPVEIVENSLSAIEFKWRPPKDDGGCPVINYNLERQQLGRNTWTKIGDIPGQPTYRDTNIDRGRKYCYRIRAKNLEGFSEILTTNDIAAGTLGEIPYFFLYSDVVNYQLLVFRKQFVLFSQLSLALLLLLK